MEILEIRLNDVTFIYIQLINRKWLLNQQIIIEMCHKKPQLIDNVFNESDFLIPGSLVIESYWVCLELGKRVIYPFSSAT